MQSFILQTERTYLTPLEKDDALHLYKLNTNFEVLKYTGDDPFQTIQDAERFLESYDQFEKYDVGRFAVRLKHNHQFIGWSGLRYSPESFEYDLGFRFFRKFWNQGFATETAMVILEYGFHTLNLERIIARTMKLNTASKRVLDKIGMQWQKNFMEKGKQWAQYDITSQSRGRKVL